MNPFSHLPEYHIVVCTGKECKYAMWPSHIDSHLSSSQHNYNREQRQQVIQEIQQIPGLIQDARGLSLFKFPEPMSPAISELKPAKDGLQCKICRYICCSRVKMRDHCKAVHQCENECKKGLPSYKKRQSAPKQPWISGVHCQQFFTQGPKSQLFEVQRITTERLKHIEKKTKESIEEVDENLEPKPWLKRVGWVRHLKGKDPERLRATIEPPDATQEPELKVIIESFGRVVGTAQRIAVQETVGINALFEINKNCATRKPAMPFSSFMGNDTLTKYRRYWEQLLCYIYRMQEDEDLKRSGQVIE
jgi:hypothetical protein